MRKSGVVLAPSKPFLLTGKFSNSFGSLLSSVLTGFGATHPWLSLLGAGQWSVGWLGTQTWQSSAQSASPIQVDRASPPVSPRQQGVAGGSGTSLTMFLSSPGRRYGSVYSAANGRSDAESGSESSRRTSRQPSLESRRSLDLSDRWVHTCAVCRVPSQSAVVGPCSHGEANTSPGKGGLVPPSPPRIGLVQGQHWDAPGVPPAPLATAPHTSHEVTFHHPAPACWHCDCLAALLPVPCPASGCGTGPLGSHVPPPVPGHLLGCACLDKSFVIWDPVMCQEHLSQLWPRSGWGSVEFPGVSCVSCIPVPQVLLPKVPG